MESGIKDCFIIIIASKTLSPRKARRQSPFLSALCAERAQSKVMLILDTVVFPVRLRRVRGFLAKPKGSVQTSTRLHGFDKTRETIFIILMKNKRDITK